MRAISLLGILLVAKIGSLAGRELPLSLWLPLAYFWQDILIALSFAALDRLLRRPKVMWLLYGLITVYVAVNVPVVRTLSTPLTWPLLRAAGAPLADSITYYLTWSNLLLVGLLLATAGALPVLVRRLANRSLILISVIGLGLALPGPWASARLDTLGLHRNALVALVTTAFPSTPRASDQRNWRASPFSTGASDDLTAYRSSTAGRSVILISLESTGAQYLKSYGAAADPMPNLTRWAAEALLFEQAYAVYPESIKGLFSVLCSTYPALHTRPELYTQVTTPALAQVLAEAGYRTALFHSGRFAYLGMESIIEQRGYHTLEDAGAIGGERNSSFGIDEPSTVRRMLGWLDALPPGQRFFLTYLPIAGHHPYEAPAGGPFPTDDELSRYRNALHDADAALGLLWRGLQDRGLDRQTLIVIMGDHGEAFGQHEGNYGHTLFIYEENLRVPLLLIAPGQWREPRRARQVASLVDLAPTVLDLLALPVPDAYQGRSLLASPPQMALFFTDYSLGLVGLRDGDWKLIHELDAGRSKLFNLKDDPTETRDLASRYPERVAAYREQLLSWAGTQRAWLTSGTP